MGGGATQAGLRGVASHDRSGRAEAAPEASSRGAFVGNERVVSSAALTDEVQKLVLPRRTAPHLCKRSFMLSSLRIFQGPIPQLARRVLPKGALLPTPSPTRTAPPPRLLAVPGVDPALQHRPGLRAPSPPPTGVSPPLPAAVWVPPSLPQLESAPALSFLTLGLQTLPPPWFWDVHPGSAAPLPLPPPSSECGLGSDR